MRIGDADRNPSNPYLISVGNQLWLAWKEFDGTKTTVPVMRSTDGGRTWSEPKMVANTADQSDHPVLVANGSQAFLSWQTRDEGFRFFPLEDVK
jgi:Neuraminidase (sialidase)